jgi:hypothetical protein
MWCSEHIRFNFTKLQILKEIIKLGSHQYNIFWMGNEQQISVTQIK